FILNMYWFKEFFSSTISKTDNIIFHPMIAHDIAFTNIRTEIPKIQVQTIERLTNKHSFLYESLDNDAPFVNQLNNKETIKKFYLSLIEKFNIQLPEEEIYGFGKLGLLLAFEDSAPDNTIPLLWYQSDKFTPLFNR
ncbi:phosphoribosyltransferase-like protein, partial [Leptospira levettii]|uniref:phosphoribosyltransferase-like protein n=1 Tax=Leptospira levettii TaxID=2023178 RepID=UPI001AEF64BF